MAPEPYKIAVPQEAVERLKTKLSLAEFPDELTDAQWDLGAPLADIKRLAKAWERWDWRQAEARLNSTLLQFHTGIKVDGFDELDIHFVWQKSEVTDAIPLLFVHGWPGSFIEVQHLLPLLAAPGGPAFHVVAPSLPNFGFSSGVAARGFGLDQYAETCHKLMLQLGYEQYATQGGDWGFYITRTIGLRFPGACRASHINMIRAHPPTLAAHPLLALQHRLTPYTASDRRGLARRDWFTHEGRGYYWAQMTKPQTLGYGLADSPVALLAWVYEKLHDWTDAYPWADDEVFTWLAIYAFSRAGPAASVRIYYEVQHTTEEAGTTRARVEKYIGGPKLGISYNPQELGQVPKTWARTLGPVVFESSHAAGGHFMAHEKPDNLAADLRAMFGSGSGSGGGLWAKVKAKTTATARL